MRINLGIRRRLAPLLENDRRRIELMNGLLFSLPGTPVIYYGDEIGMGDNIYLGDRNGVRTPMQWSGDRNAGFSRANPQRLYLPVNIDPEYHYEAINVETQQNNPHSLLWWMKRVVALRKQLRAMGRGTPGVPLSREPPRAGVRPPLRGRARAGGRESLALHAVRGAGSLASTRACAPLELFGSTRVSRRRRPAVLPLAGPARVLLVRAAAEGSARRDGLRIRTGEPPTLLVESWENVFSAGGAGDAESDAAVRSCAAAAGIRGRNRTIRVAEIHDVIPFPKSRSYLVLIRVEFTEGDPEFYTLAALGRDRRRRQIRSSFWRGCSGRDGEHGRAVQRAAQSRVLRRDAGRDSAAQAVSRAKRASCVASHTRAFRAHLGRRTVRRSSRPLSRADQDNTTLFYGDRFALKLLRKVEEGPHPEQEIGALLTKDGFPCVAPLAGTIEYRTPEGEPVTVGAAARVSCRDAVEGWQYTLDHSACSTKTRWRADPADRRRMQPPAISDAN